MNLLFLAPLAFLKFASAQINIQQCKVAFELATLILWDFIKHFRKNIFLKNLRNFRASL